MNDKSRTDIIRDKAWMLDAIISNTCGKSVGMFNGKKAVLHIYDLHCAEAILIVADENSSEVLFFEVVPEGFSYSVATKAGFSEVLNSTPNKGI